MRKTMLWKYSKFKIVFSLVIPHRLTVEFRDVFLFKGHILLKRLLLIIN